MSKGTLKNYEMHWSAFFPWLHPKAINHPQNQHFDGISTIHSHDGCLWQPAVPIFVTSDPSTIIAHDDDGFRLAERHMRELRSLHDLGEGYQGLPRLAYSLASWHV